MHIDDANKKRKRMSVDVSKYMSFQGTDDRDQPNSNIDKTIKRKKSAFASSDATFGISNMHE